MSTTSAVLPEEFADLESFANDWVLPTEPLRYAKRVESSMDELQLFYDATFPRGKAAIKYLNQFELDALPEQANNLMLLLYSLISVSFSIECYKQQKSPDTGACYLDLLQEPVP